MSSSLETESARTMEVVRTFVAVSLPASLLDLVIQVQERLRSHADGRPVRWTAREQLHLTLKFLGNVPRGDLTRLRECLGSAGAGLSVFELALAGLGCFPQPVNPRVVWIGVTGAVGQLEDLQRRVEAATCGFGDHADERQPFHPHLTIGRVKARGNEGRKVGNLLARERVPELGTWPVRQVHLMQSELRPQGAHYTCLHSVSLGD